MTNETWYIDAEALMELARNHVGGTVDCNDIARLPRAEVVKVIHGEWIVECKNSYRCSNCFKSRNSDVQRGWDFCPFCGSKNKFR